MNRDTYDDIDAKGAQISIKQSANPGEFYGAHVTCGWLTLMNIQCTLWLKKRGLLYECEPGVSKPHTVL
jgi:hypothetical protein